ncbi:MAG TPA: M24 family metallopeptidase [Pseudomonadales bacterium]|nr:M24 family metallopeptidase [Pseudomonadales bacterium]
MMSSRRRLHGPILLMVLATAVLLPPAAGALPRILPLEQRAAVIDGWTRHRIEQVLPDLMRRTGIDLWVIISREYNEDPVIRTMLPATEFAARRRTMLLIFDPGDGAALETLSVSRYGVGDSFEGAWDKEADGDQWTHLAKLIAERDPQRIGIDVSEDWSHADGLPQTEYRLLMAALPEQLHGRVTSAEQLAVAWLETRSEPEMAVYPLIVRIAHEIIAEGLSEAVIQPGVTTTDAVQWWYRERLAELKLATWFHPSVSVQRADMAESDHETAVLAEDVDVIRPGDLVHVDFGLTYLRLNTDTQQHAYVLRPGETEAPAELQEALARGNRLQDILTGNFRLGRTGNEVLAMSLAQAAGEGIEASIYTHPLGYHGHAAGTTIGMWDQQGGVPGSGDHPLQADTVFSIELYAATSIDAWADKKVRIRLEEDAFFDGEAVRYLDGRQTRFHLIPRPARTGCCTPGP